jgi:hypothetical protein
LNLLRQLVLQLLLQLLLLLLVGGARNWSVRHRLQTIQNSLQGKRKYSCLQNILGGYILMVL